MKDDSQTTENSTPLNELDEQILHSIGEHRSLEYIFENIGCGAAIYKLVDGHFEVVFVNSTAIRLIGYDKATLSPIPRAFSVEVYPPDGALLHHALFVDLMKDGCVEHTYRAICADGSLKWIKLTMKRINDGDEVEYLATFADIDREMRKDQVLRFRANHDELTGIYSKNAFYTHVQNLINLNADTDYVLSVLNVDRFKQINELYGAETGDKVLLKITKTLNAQFDNIGIYGRLHSDHFAFCVPEKCFDPESFLGAVDSALSELELQHKIQVELGIIKVTDRTLSIDLLCDRANLAMKSIANEYNTHYAYFTDAMYDELKREQEIRDRMAFALENDEFKVYLQPVMSVFSGDIAGAEALARWQLPSGEVLPPARFIPIFEQNGFISELDKHVWKKACRIQAERLTSGEPMFPISVNASRRSLVNPNLAKEIAAMLDAASLPHEYFNVEVTESAYVDNPDQLVQTINELRSFGITVLMDDFGSGYSAFNAFKNIPVDKLKIDMQFLDGFEKGGRVGTILTSMLRMTQWLNLPVVAEGVETVEQLDFLRSIGCEYIQGYYLAKPMPSENFSAFHKNTAKRAAIQPPQATSLKARSIFCSAATTSSTNSSTACSAASAFSSLSATALTP